MHKLQSIIKDCYKRDKVFSSLFALFAVFLVTLLISQIFLKNSSTREMLTSIEKYENISYEANADIPKGTVTVKLESGEPSEKIEIWFNGEKTDEMTEKKKTITVDCSGVIEIKNDSGNRISASVEDVSDNMEILMSNKPEIESGIKVLCSVSIRD